MFSRKGAENAEKTPEFVRCSPPRLRAFAGTYRPVEEFSRTPLAMPVIHSTGPLPLSNLMLKSMKRRLWLVVGLLLGAGAACLVYLSFRTAPEPPLPNPNGTEDFAQAALQMGSQGIDVKSLPLDELRRLVDSHQPALALVRSGLMKECRVIPYLLTSPTNDHISTIGSYKRLANLFSAASRLERFKGHTNAAAILGLECVRFGHESVRGGVVIDGLVGLALQSIGLAAINESLAGTDAATARQIAATLERIAQQRELPATIFLRERRWAREGRFGSANVFTLWIQPILQRGARAKSEQKFTQVFAQHQRTLVDAASRAYELDHGKPPGAVRDLVPQYLKSVPTDPTTGQELR